MTTNQSGSIDNDQAKTLKTNLTRKRDSAVSLVVHPSAYEVYQFWRLLPKPRHHLELVDPGWLVASSSAQPIPVASLGGSRFGVLGQFHQIQELQDAPRETLDLLVMESEIDTPLEQHSWAMLFRDLGMSGDPVRILAAIHIHFFGQHHPVLDSEQRLSMNALAQLEGIPPRVLSRRVKALGKQPELPSYLSTLLEEKSDDD